MKEITEILDVASGNEIDALEVMEKHTVPMQVQRVRREYLAEMEKLVAAGGSEAAPSAAGSAAGAAGKSVRHRKTVEGKGAKGASSVIALEQQLGMQMQQRLQMGIQYKMKDGLYRYADNPIHGRVGSIGCPAESHPVGEAICVPPLSKHSTCG